MNPGRESTPKVNVGSGPVFPLFLGEDQPCRSGMQDEFELTCGIGFRWVRGCWAYRLGSGIEPEEHQRHEDHPNHVANVARCALVGEKSTGKIPWGCVPQDWEMCALRRIALETARHFSRPMMRTGNMKAALSNSRKARVGSISGMLKPNMTMDAV